MKNSIIDMGNVLTNYSMTEYIRNHTENEREAEIIRRQVCESVEWIQMDRGAMSDEEALAAICTRVPECMWTSVETFIRNFRMEQEPNPLMENLVRRLSEAGYELYLMSNTSHRFRKFSKSIASIAYMKDIWISCEHGFLKPEPQAYENFFEVMRLEPGDCFFVDDSPANIEAALRCGMRGCVYHQDMLELERNLRAAGVEF